MAKRTGVNEWYTYPAGQNPSHKPAGVYKLTKDIANPNADGRSGRWQRQGTIKAGQKFLLTDNCRRDYGNEVEGGPRIIVVDGCCITKVNSKNYDQIDRTFFCYEDLLAALEPVTNVNTEDYLSNLKRQHGYAADPEAIITRMLQEGTITREQVENAVQTNENDPNF
jgi:hypothetical protein